MQLFNTTPDYLNKGPLFLHLVVNTVYSTYVLFYACILFRTEEGFLLCVILVMCCQFCCHKKNLGVIIFGFLVILLL